METSKPSLLLAIRFSRALARPSRKEVRMWLGIAILFLIGWLIAFIAFHVAVAGIHILLALFVIFLIIHFVRKARRTT